MKRYAAPLFCLLAVACGESTGPGAIEPTARQPVVFVHGIGGSAADWSGVIARFKADGWTDRELIAASYSSLVSNTTVANAIRDRVDSVVRATGWPKVDMVTFSMGSLSSRYYLKNLGGTARVDAWVSVAGPNHGTDTAFQCTLTPCVEMRPGSAFLAQLNSGDETPGPTRYATWWSPCDQTVVPPQSTILDGAVNTQTECLPHAGMFTEANYLQVRNFIAPE
jgi:triacylglycerol lipase